MQLRTAAAARAALCVLLLAGCGSAPRDWLPGPFGESAAERNARNQAAAEREEADAQREEAAARARTRAAVPLSPLDVAPAAGESRRVWTEAVRARGVRVVVSIGARSLWLMDDTATVFRAPVAVGMNDGFTYGGKRFYFETPIGVRRVLAKSPDPLWVPPDWHYLEKVVQRGLKPVYVRPDRREMLDDGSWIEIRAGEVGRVNQFGNFAPFTPGNEIIFDGRIFIPPFGTAQRQIPDVLGTHKVEIGDGYLIHGTNQATSIGDAVSHGCVRMYNEDVDVLYGLVEVGTAVYLF
jgi:hypothetical protein